MRRLSISLDDQAANWLRSRAAERNTSVSGFVRDTLHREMDRADRYQAAMTAFMATPPFLEREPGESWPSRDETHRRSGLAGPITPAEACPGKPSPPH